MAAGITQVDVDQAADSLLLAGERPTVERVRQHLGSGSPNTVTRLLDVWWRGLGARLSGQQRKVEMPDAPEAVAMLASQFWEKALELAEAQAHALLAAEREALAAAELAAEARVAASAQARDEARAAQAQAAIALASAQERLDERQQLIAQQAAQLEDLARQRDHALAQAQAASADVDSLRSQLARDRDDAEAVRSAQAAHLQAVENRAHAEVDRARQEARDLKSQLQAVDRAHRERLKQLEADLAQARTALATSSRDLAAETARRETLDRQLNELQQSLKDALTPLAGVPTSKARGARPARKREAEPQPDTTRARPRRSK